MNNLCPAISASTIQALRTGKLDHLIFYAFLDLEKQPLILEYQRALTTKALYPRIITNYVMMHVGFHPTTSVVGFPADPHKGWKIENLD